MGRRNQVQVLGAADFSNRLPAPGSRETTLEGRPSSPPGVEGTCEVPASTLRVPDRL